MGTNPSENGALGAGRDKGHDVAGQDRGIEWLGLAGASKVELCEVSHDPGGPGVVRLRRRDQLGVDVDPDDHVATCCQFCANASRSATGVEDPRARCNHGINQTGLTGEIDSVGGHLPEPVYVPLRVLRSCICEPSRRRAHGQNVAAQ